MNPYKICQYYACGLMTHREALEALDRLKIRGGFSVEYGGDCRPRGLTYTGYDYENQEWITWAEDRPPIVA